MRTALFVTLAVIAGGLFDSFVFAAGYDNLSEFDGRGIVVRIYRKKSEGGSSVEEKTLRIKDGTFQLSEDDLAGSVGIEVDGSKQKDPLVKQQVGRDSHSYRPWEGPVFGLPVREDELEGRLVVVRVCEDWQRDPGAYRQMPAAVRKGSITFDFADVNGPAFVAVLGEDQNDNLVKKVLGQRVHGWAYAKGLKYALPLKVVLHKQQDLRWTFFDALGNPVPNAQVQIYMGHYDESNIWIGRTDTDKDGVTVLPFCGDTDEARFRSGRTTHVFDSSPLCFVVRHADYGQSVVYVRSDLLKEPAQSVIIPTVPSGSEASQRAVWGLVLDEQNNPVSGLYVRSSCFYPPGAGRVDSISGQNCGVITDEQGRFRLYLPPDEDSVKIGQLIPPNSEYKIAITPPKDLGLLPYSGRIPNGREAIIVLERPGYFHTFVFEDVNGPIEDRARLNKISVRVKRPGKGRGLFLRYDDFGEGGLFPVGRYEARMSLGTDAHLDRIERFEPVEVTAESPERLVFKAAPQRTYYGQVVDGITGQPVGNAFVIDRNSTNSGRNLSMLTDAEWQKIYAIDRAISRFDKEFGEAWKAVGSCYSFSQIVPTDANGWFEMVHASKSDLEALVVFAKDYLTVIIGVGGFEPAIDNRVKMPQVKLFGAAKVRMQTWAENPYDRSRPSVWPRCIIDMRNSPEWIGSFQNVWGTKDSTFKGYVRKNFSVKLNRDACFPVPADLNLTLQLRPFHSDREKGWAPLTVARNINLERGQVLDLGRQQIPRSVPMFVEVLNSAGQTVEGVPVNADDQYGRQVSNTGEEGVAIFELAPDSEGLFIVDHKAAYAQKPTALIEQTPYRITGPADANSIYTLSLSNELLQHLFK